MKIKTKNIELIFKLLKDYEDNSHKKQKHIVFDSDKFVFINLKNIFLESNLKSFVFIDTINFLIQEEYVKVSDSMYNAVQKIDEDKDYMIEASEYGRFRINSFYFYLDVMHFNLLNNKKLKPVIWIMVSIISILWAIVATIFATFF